MFKIVLLFALVTVNQKIYKFEGAYQLVRSENLLKTKSIRLGIPHFSIAGYD